MNEVSSFVFYKKFKSVLVGKKKLILIKIPYLFCGTWSKMFFENKSPDLCCYDKKMIFNDRKIRSVFICFKRMKKIFFQKRVSLII